MHVVQVNYAYDRRFTQPGELLERYTTLTGWSSALAARGATVTVVQCFGRAARERIDDVEYRFCRAGEMNRAVVAASPDVVHVNGLVFPVQTWLLGRALRGRAPVVLQDHAGWHPRRGGMLSSIRMVAKRRALTGAGGFLFAAAELAEPWQRERIIRPHQPVFEVMEAAPAVTRMGREEARRASGIEGWPALLWVGRLNANKDPLRVLAGFERAAPHLPGATLTMVYQQDDLLRAVVRRVRESDELRERVRLVGAVRHDRLAAYYSAADMFVLGSHSEGSGYALLEACACGAVPIVTDIPSFRAITDRGRLGALWRVGDGAAFAHALVDLAARDLAALSARVVSHVEERFSWPAIASAAIAAYEEARRRHARGGAGSGAA